MQAHDMAEPKEEEYNLTVLKDQTSAESKVQAHNNDHKEMKTKMDQSNNTEQQHNTPVNESSINSNTEAKTKDATKMTDTRNAVTEKVKQLEAKFQSSSNHTKDPQTKSQQASTESSLKQRITELESELQTTEQSESKLSSLYTAQTSQLEQAMVLLEKFKLEIASLREDQSHGSELTSQESDDHSISEEMERLQTELWVERENYARALERERQASLKAENLAEEMAKLKHELRLATEAEEKSKRAMDDLALALKEVATEANQTKEKLSSAEDQLEFLKRESEQLKDMIKTTDEEHQAILSELKKENEVLKNTADRLRDEVEETLVAYTEKEIEFVKCIKRVEDERASSQLENERLNESLREIEDMHERTRDEVQKLRDILKQALNEANVAKEAAEIARAENSTLKDSLIEKDKALVALSQENERLKTSQAAAQETIKELKKPVSTPSGGNKKDSKMVEEKEHHPPKDQKKVAKKESSSIDKDMVVCTLMPKTFSFDLKELIPGLPARHKDIAIDDLEKDDELMDSIFDLVEPPAENAAHHRHQRTVSSAFLDDEKSLDLEDYEHEESSNSDDAEIDRGTQGKKRLLRRFGDLLRRRNQSCPSPKEHPKDVQKEHSKEHQKEHSKEHQKDHKKEQKEHHKEHQKEHQKDHQKEQHKEHQKDHKKEQKEYHKEHQKEHQKDHQKEQHKEHQKQNQSQSQLQKEISV